jgi:hypothetical protein
VILVVCPSNIRKVRVATHELFADVAPAVSDGQLEVEQTYERTIHDHRRVMPYLESAFGERMRTEYVVVLRKREADQSIIRSLDGAGSTATISGRAIEVNDTIA